MNQPETKYARSGDAWIAYQVTGKGLIDIVLVTGITMPIDAHYDLPEFAQFIERLSRFSRVIRYDRRGMGLSDPVVTGEPPTLEQWTADGLAVCDAVGAERPTFLAADIGGGVVVLMTAAAHPSRVASLVLMHPTPCPTQRDDWTHGIPVDDVPQALDGLQRRWLDGEVPTFAVESLSESQRAWHVRAQRRGASPTTARMVFKAWFETDVRSLLGTITAPTLVLHRPGATVIRHDASRYVAEQIAGARYVALEGDAPYIFLGDAEASVAEIQEFLTGIRPTPVSEDRVFAALLFTDIVSSTEQAAAVGDAKWRALLDSHDAIVRSSLERYRGRWVNPTGDGVLATFDGPARAVGCAQAIHEHVRELGIDVRAGIHAGEVVARGQDVTGIAVSIAHRVASLANASEILVSRTVTDLVAGSGLEFEDRGEHALKGVQGEWRVYAVK